ncbi:hypothetical protein AB1N83_004278 [Pleurotus pulmonarius]
MDPNMSCSSTGSLHDYYCDYYNFYPSVGSSYSNDSTMSTRSKQCAAGVYKRNRHNMDSALKDDLCGLILGGVEMEEYVEKIYGVSEDDFKYIKSKDWKLVGLPVYTKLLNAGAPEEDLYAPFKTIMANLFDTFIQDKKRLNVHHASLGKTALKSVGSVRKPDQLFFFGSHNDESPITWSLAKAFVEFAVTPSAQRVKATFGLDGAEGLDDKRKQSASGLPANSTSAMVAKLSWPSEKRPWLEASTIKDLLEKIPRMKHHLPQIRCAITLKGESIGLPRHLFRDMTTAHKLEQRYFTLLFTDCYYHLWDVKTVADFQLAYIDIVECHHAAMKFGKVLHRDISENNLLWTKSPKSSKRTAVRTIGVLNDWDLATPVDATGSSSKHRTGTGPFMALDLLAPEPPVHLYRHDLESLFYVLIWAAVHYNIGHDVPYAHRVDDELEKWTGSYLEALSAKTLFLSDTEPVLKRIRPAFQGLRLTWIESLCELFQRAQSHRVLLASQRKKEAQPETQVVLDDDNDVFAPLKEGQVPANMNIDDDDESDHDEEKESEPHLPPPPAAPAPPPKTIDYDTLGGCLTFENFMAALKWTPRVIRPVDNKNQASEAT